MKQYTSTEQTDKLIELGFAPKAKIKEVRVVHPKVEIAHDCNFTIGELIEMLPKKIEICDDETGELDVSFGDLCMVYYTSFGFIYYNTVATELIDALYDMIVKLKEKFFYDHNENYSTGHQ